MTQNSWNSEDPVQVAKGGIGKAATTAYAVQCGGTTSTSALQDIVSVGTAGQVLTSNGAAALPTFQTTASGSGIMVQQVRTSTTTTSSTAVHIPADNTIPQITEGAEIFSLAITPTNASNILMMEWSLGVNVVTQPQCTLAIFVDSTADAIFAIPYAVVNATYSRETAGRFYLTAGSTSARTYSVRYGTNSTGSASINPILYGGVAFSCFTITEIEV